MTNDCEVAISVLMPVYNGEKYLREAIDSILMQTFTDFELLILLEYGSNEASRKIVYGYDDKRIRVIENEKKLGLPMSLNEGIKTAKGKYIARMDADDVSYKNRLKIQYRYMEKHPNIDLCGAAAKVNGEYKAFSGFCKHDEIRFGNFLGCTFIHPTVIWRRDVFIENNLFYKNLVQSEDYELWMRAIECVQTANINKTVLFYRVHNTNKSVVGNKELEEYVNNILKDYWERNNLCLYPEETYLDNYSLSQECIIELYRLKELSHKLENFSGRRKIIRYRAITWLLNDKQNYKQVFEIIQASGLQNEISKKRDGLYVVYRILRRRIRLKLPKL